MAKLYKPKPARGNVLEEGRKRFARLYEVHDTVVIAFSGGKDSTVILNLAIEAATAAGKLPVRVAFWDEEAIPYETEQYVRRTYNRADVDLLWLCVPCQHRNACSSREPFWYPWDGRIQDKWVRALPPEAVTKLAGFQPYVDKIADANHLLVDLKKDGVSCVVRGLRAQESLMRHRASLMRSGRDSYITHIGGGFYQAAPIYDWRTEDVWRAHHTLGWDHNEAYDRMDKAGMSPSIQRVAPPYGEEPLQNLWMYKVCFPEIWEKMYNRVAGAATAARYSRTELYGFGGFPPKPDNRSWEQHVMHFVEKFDAEHRRYVAMNIKQTMQMHYSKTDEPILPMTPHPFTGVSWKYIFKIAMRGNFKGRLNPPQVDYNKVKPKYDAERKELGL